MGAYLSSPVTDKSSEDGTTEKFDYGASAMQGWRYYMEDAHNCISDLDDGTALFGVYDGHGGAEVAIYCAQHLPDFIKNGKAYKEGQLGKGLQDAFMEFDATLTQEDVIRELRQIAGTMQETDGDQDEEETTKLTEEATLPLTELLAKYGYQLKEQANTKSLRKKVNQEDLLSPVIRKTQSKINPLSEALAGEKDSELGDKKTGDQISEDSNHKQTDSKEESDDKQTKSDPDQSEVTDSEVTKQCNGKTAHLGNGKANGDATSKTESNDKCEESVAGQSGLGNGDVAEEEDDDEDDEEYKDENDEIDDDDEDEESEESDDDDDDDDEGDEDEEDEEEGDDEKCGDEKDGGAVKGIMGLSDKEEPGSDSGCTAVVALMRGDQLIVANAGDSRCIVSRSGDAIDMSIDHKPEDEPERLRIENAGGKVTSDGRVNGGLNLSRAIGDHCYKQNKELPADQQMISAFPDIQSLTITPEDEFIVVACDGIWNVLSSQETVDFVKERIDKMKLSSICEEMFDHCLAPDSLGDGTGCDNMTCIIVKLKHTSQDSKQLEAGSKRTASPDTLSSASPAKRAKN